MKARAATTQQAEERCLATVAVWQMILKRLLDQHYGRTRSDSP
ncbi:toxin, partial [Escherichia coli]